MKALIMMLFVISVIKAEIINVHIIPHTHDDAGWLFTMDQYYYGNNNMNKCVKCILDNMLISLAENDKRKFTYVEMSFFEKWFSGLEEIKKEEVRKLVKENRLEFINGGWVMNDEAASHYQDIIDQMRLGLHFLEKEFQVRPKTAWYIDPFGHSKTNAYILSQLGFENLVMVRIDYREKEKRIAEKTLEFNWRPYFDMGITNKIFTHITTGHYNPPDSLSEILESDYSNVQHYKNKLNSIYNDFLKIRNGYNTNEVLFLYGDDFTFKDASVNYKNIEAMIEAFNQSTEYKDKINFFYSTPSQYFKAVSSKGLEFPNLDGFDFFPYADGKLDYWTGYFSSRPYLKGLIRDSGSFLKQASNLMINRIFSFKESLRSFYEKLYNLRRQLGVAQHHDAVTGTAKEKTSMDYINRLNEGINDAKSIIKEIMERDISKLESEGKYDDTCIDGVSIDKCLLKVYSSQDIDRGIIFVFLNTGVDFPFKLKIENKSDVKITDISTGKILNNDIFCQTELNYCLLNSFLRFESDQVYKIISIKSEPNSSPFIKPEILTNSSVTLIDNDNTSLKYDSSQRKFIQTIKATGVIYEINVSHGYYSYDRYRDSARKNRSGAYLMATNDFSPVIFNLKSINYFKGVNLDQINLLFDNSILILRVYKDNKYDYVIDTESIIFPGRPNHTNEFVLVIDSNIDNVSNSLTTFYTDSNSLGMVKRIQDTRDLFQFTVDDKVASNFYPVDSQITIKDNNKIMNVYNDRSQSGTSLNKGQIYFILNRWSDDDDRKGLAEELYESSSSKINFHLNHWIMIGKQSDKTITKFINERPIYSIYNKSSKLKLLWFANKFLSQNKDFSSYKFSKYGNNLFTIDEDCIEYNYYFISPNEVLVQFLNKSEPLFESKKCSIKINIGDWDVKSISLNGLDQEKNPSEIYEISSYEFVSLKYIFK